MSWVRPRRRICLSSPVVGRWLGEGGGGNAEANYTQFVLQGGGESHEQPRVIRNCVESEPWIEQSITRFLGNVILECYGKRKRKEGRGERVWEKWLGRLPARQSTLPQPGQRQMVPGPMCPLGPQCLHPNGMPKSPPRREPHISLPFNHPTLLGSTPQPPINPTPCPPSHLPLRTRMAAS
jgi:hypothetical protein